jgi:RNA polymerase sigma-70 factor (sigma-E family)
MAREQLDAAAFTDFVAARSGGLFRTAYLLVGDYHLAQDLVQESLIKLYAAWPRIRGLAEAEAYARKTMVTTAISWRRRRSFHERPTEPLPEVEVEVAATGDVIDAQEELWRELLRVPPRQRAAVVLRYCEDLSEAQSAELMGCSVGAVKKQASLGLAKLRARMGERITLPVQPTSDESAVVS